MKLEVKYLVPYLPYRLQVIDLKGSPDIMLSVVNNNENPHVMTRYGGMTCTRTCLQHLKPLFRPLSELENFICDNFDNDIDIRTFFNYEIIGEDGIFESFDDFLEKKPEFALYGMLEVMFKYHFDVFRLIDNDLAVAIDKLT